MIVLGIIPVVIGVLLLCAFLSSLIGCRTETEAVIVRIHEKKRFWKGRTIYDCTPEFSYTVNGKEYTAKTESSYSDPKKFSVGQKLTVFIDASHPERVRYGSNVGFGITGIVLALIGIFIIVLACM